MRTTMTIGLSLALGAGFATRLLWPGTILSRLNVLDLAVGLVVVIALVRHWRHITLGRWLSAWLALVALSAFWGAARFGWSPETFLYIVRVSVYGLFFGVAARWPVEWRLKWLAWLGGGLAIIGLIQLVVWPTIPVSMGITHGFDPHSGRLFGLWFDPNIAAALLMLTSLGTWSLVGRDQSWRRPWPYLGMLQLAAILLTDSRSGWISLAVALGYLIYQINRRWLLLLLAGAIMLPILSVGVANRLAGLLSVDDTVVARLVSWQTGWSVVEQSPLIGVGYNYFKPAAVESGGLKMFYGQINLAANGSDSSLLTIWATTGLVGLLVFVAGLIGLGWHQREAASRAALIGILINSLFINSLLLGPTWFLLAIIWGRED